ncbi:MAG: thermopsin family protease [Thermoplasmata archaeon]
MTARHVSLVVLVAALTLLSLGVGLAGARPVGASPTAVAPVGSASTAPLTVAPPAPAATSPPGNASRMALEQRILTTASNDHIPIEAVSLPNLLGQSTVSSNGVVSPRMVQAPAPMGIGAYGVRNNTGTATAFSYRTTSWEGSITLNSVNNFLLDNDGAISTNGSQNTFGVQLNAMTTHSTVGSKSSYTFWTQNVLYFNYPEPGYITFLDNVWNFSSPAVSLTQGTIFSGNGTPVYPEYYYDIGPSLPLIFPLTVHLYLNSSTTDNLSNGYGYTTVRFGYNVVDPTTGSSEASGVYDTVMFNSTKPFADVPRSPFLVDGSRYTPTGYIPYDAEIMIGGPGGGTTTSIYGISGSESLQYWDNAQHAYVAPKSAWNFGSETGETSEGISETYTTPGTVTLSTGPSIPMPLWGGTPGGNLGSATLSGPLSPSNAFVFATPGSVFDANYASWAPTQTASSVHYVVPPGTYTVDAMLSDYAPIQTTVTVANGGHASLSFNLHRDDGTGVYTPLFAWNNGQLAAISSGGTGSAAHPYQIVNNPAPGGLNPVFGEFNDYLFEVFPGVLFAGTTAHVDLNHPASLGLTYQTGYQAELAFYGLPLTNHLQFEVVDASDVTIWGAHDITGWFFYDDYGPSGGLPIANVVVWGGSHDLVGDSTFVSQGSSLLLAGVDPFAPTGNVVWGNTFVNSSQLSPTMYPAVGASNGPPIAIFAFEAGDWIYNNWVGTSITAYAPNENMFFGFYQVNLENWNLPMVEPRGYSVVFNGYDLTGTIVSSHWQGGNYWIDYAPGSSLPYNESGYIAAGGDYLPLPIVAYKVTFTLSERGSSADWEVTLNGVSQSTYSHTLVFYETPGTYTFSATVLTQGPATVTPSSGVVLVSHHSVRVPLRLG